MKNSKAKKIQRLVVSQLLDVGTVEILLPDGIVLEIGITQEDKEGEFTKTDDYCYVVATRDKKTTILDSYNLGLQYEENTDTIVCEGGSVDTDGSPIRFLDVV
jgi:hypothetical protein